jgi:hypothetical protein
MLNSSRKQWCPASSAYIPPSSSCWAWCM